MIKPLEVIAEVAPSETKIREYFEHSKSYKEKYYSYKLEMLRLRQEETKRRFERYGKI